LEYVAVDKATYVPTALDSKPNGKCCITSNYGANSCSDISALTAAMKSSKVYKQKEIALANCANLTTHCGTKQALDLDGGKVDITVGKAGVKLTKNDACSYIATSKCKAPTVDIGAVDSKNVGL
jgi:hypothetical protein